jgi:hypothetical protein
MTTSSPWRYPASAAAMTALAVLSACGTPTAGKEAASSTVVVALNDTQLGRIRGGFDVSPNFSINFGFQQTTSVNNQQVSQILIPDLTIGPSDNGGVDKAGSPPNPIYTVVSSSPTTTGTRSSQIMVPMVVANNGGIGTTSPTHSTALVTPTIVTSGGTSGITTSSVLPSPQTGIASSDPKSTSVVIPSVATGGRAGGGFASNVGSQVAVVQDRGVTNIMTQLGGGGLTSIIQNNANNTLVQQATTINLAIAGLSPLMSVQSSNFSLNAALALGAALRH